MEYEEIGKKGIEMKYGKKEEKIWTLDENLKKEDYFKESLIFNNL